MDVKHFFDQETSTLTYIVYDKKTKDALIIDPVLNYDSASSEYNLDSVRDVLDFVAKQSLCVHYILETHAHADHLTGSQFLKKSLQDAQLAIGANIKAVQSTFKTIFNFKDFNENGVQFDQLLDDNSMLKVGSLQIETFYTPGHTPACVCYYINKKAVFTGDTLFMPDFGTGRCDFPGGSSAQLYDSITKRLYVLPDDTKVYVGHDYRPNGRDLAYESTIKEQKESNIHITSKTSKEDFVEFRDKRDATLTSPKLLLQSLQVNIDAGHLPSEEDDGASYLKIPLRPKG